jgi:translation initiation factor 3 subunit J
MDDDWENATGLADEPEEDKWAGEDEDDVADNWDDSEEEEEQPKKDEKPKAVKPKKLSKQKMKKKLEAERAAREKKAQAVRAARKANPELAALSRLEERKLVEQADHELTESLFGMGVSEVKKEVIKETVSVQDTIDSIPIETAKEIEAFAKMIAEKVVKDANKKSDINKFLKIILEKTTKGMKLDVVNKTKQVITVICNDARKKEVGKKKKGNKKKSLAVGGRGAMFDDYGDMGSVDDYDFL